MILPVALAALALLFGLEARALADGKVFASINHSAVIPDQQALIAWRDGVQTLAIETRFEGTGREFAWVVPFPAPPEIAPATMGLFPTLQVIGGPRLANQGGAVGAMLLILALTAIGWILARRVATVSRAAATLCILLVSFTAFCLLVVPQLGSARGLSDTQGVTVADRRLVGSFETVTITGDSADPLMAWLNGNGFDIPAAARPAIADYIARGWCFVAARLRRDAEEGLATPHPLVFRFPTAAPIYPLKLTGTDGRDLSVELYVFGPGTAAAPGFEVVRSFKPKYESPEQHRPVSDRAVISHAGVRALADDLPVFTSLKARLSPARMAADAAITFGPFKATHAEVHTPGSAARLGFDWGAAVFAIVLAGAGAVSVFRAARGKPASGLGTPIDIRTGAVLASAARAALLGVAAGLVVWKMLPTTEVTTGRNPFITSSRLASLGESLAQAAHESGLAPGQITLEWAGEHVRSAITEHDGAGSFSPREEDSPGNYTFRPTEEGLSFHFYNMMGNEGVVPLGW